MPITFTGGQSMPAYGTSAYSALSTASSKTSGNVAGNYNPTSGTLTAGSSTIYSPPVVGAGGGTSVPAPTDTPTKTPVNTSALALADYNQKYANYQKLVADLEAQSQRLGQQAADAANQKAQQELQQSEQNLKQQGVDIQKAQTDAKNKALGLVNEPVTTTGDTTPQPTGQVTPPVSTTNAPQGIVAPQGGTPQTGATTSATPVDNIQVANDANAQAQNQILDAKTSAITQFQQQVAQIMNGTFPLSADQNALVNSVQMSLERQKQSIVGTMSMEAARGGQEYTPGQMASNLAAKVMNLDAMAAGTMASLRMGFMKQDYDMINSAYEKQTQYLDDKANTIQKLHDEVIKTEEIKREEANKITESINKVAEEAAKGGATSKIIKAILDSRNLSDAISIAGNSLQIGSGTGIVAEYNFYKKDAISRGMTPLSFDEYQTKDANRKAAIAGGTGLSTQQNAIVNSTVSSFEANPIVKDFVMIQGKYMNALNTIGKGDGATDISMIYDFMKALDPTSVVRETEYATGAEKSGNIFAGKLAKLNGLIDPQGGFISDTAKANIIGAMEQRFNTAKSQYENIRKEKIRTLNSRGVPEGDAYIPQYDYNQSLGKQINDENEKKETDAEAKVAQYGDNHPESRQIIIKMRSDGLSMQDINNWINQQMQ
jgi:hypothetical protein